MTIIVRTWLFETVLISLLVLLVLFCSLIISKWMRKKEIERKKKIENLVAFSLTLLVGALYFAIHEHWISTAYQGDVIITEETDSIVKQQSVRYVSTERPIHLVEIYTYGFPYQLETNNEPSVTIRIIHYQAFYQDAKESDFHATNNTFDFQGYINNEVGPYITEVYEQYADETKDQEMISSNVLKDLEEAFPYYHFEFNE